jgi:hypothetical protein
LRVEREEVQRISHKEGPGARPLFLVERYGVAGVMMAISDGTAVFYREGIPKGRVAGRWFFRYAVTKRADIFLMVDGNQRF